MLVPGLSLHEELVLLVQAGLTPSEALQTATVNPAKIPGMADSLGTIEAGKLADSSSSSTRIRLRTSPTPGGSALLLPAAGSTAGLTSIGFWPRSRRCINRLRTKSSDYENLPWRFRAYAVPEKGAAPVPFSYRAEVGAHDVVVKLTHRTITRGDLQMIENDWGDTRFPLVPSHEMVGIVGYR